MSSPTADVSVRVAWADDAPAIGALQVRAWRTAYAGLLPGRGAPGRDGRDRRLAVVDDPPGRCAQPGAGRAGAQPRRGLRGGRPCGRSGLRPDRRRRAARAHGRRRRARQGARLPAAHGRRGHDGGRPLHPRGALGDRRPTTSCAPSSPARAGPPTRPTGSSTSTAPAAPGSSRCGCTPHWPEPALRLSFGHQRQKPAPRAAVGDQTTVRGPVPVPSGTGPRPGGGGQPTLTALQAAATALYCPLPLP